MTNNQLPRGLIRHDVLQRLSAEQAKAAFAAAWPVELRERWPTWMKEAIDKAERLSADAFGHGFEMAVHEIFTIRDNGVARSKE